MQNQYLPLDQEVGPITRAEKAEFEVEQLRMLLLNLTTAVCILARDKVSNAIVEAHKEASEMLGLNCPHCLLVKQCLNED